LFNRLPAASTYEEFALDAEVLALFKRATAA
jgi:hypothetical protein